MTMALLSVFTIFLLLFYYSLVFVFTLTVPDRSLGGTPEGLVITGEDSSCLLPLLLLLSHLPVGQDGEMEHSDTDGPDPM